MKNIFGLNPNEQALAPFLNDAFTETNSQGLTKDEWNAHVVIARLISGGDSVKDQRPNNTKRTLGLESHRDSLTVTLTETKVEITFHQTPLILSSNSSATALTLENESALPIALKWSDSLDGSERSTDSDLPDVESEPYDVDEEEINNPFTKALISLINNDLTPEPLALVAHILLRSDDEVIKREDTVDDKGNAVCTFTKNNQSRLSIYPDGTSEFATCKPAKARSGSRKPEGKYTKVTTIENEHLENFLAGVSFADPDYNQFKSPLEEFQSRLSAQIEDDTLLLEPDSGLTTSSDSPAKPEKKVSFENLAQASSEKEQLFSEFLTGSVGVKKDTDFPATLQQAQAQGLIKPEELNIIAGYDDQGKRFIDIILPNDITLTFFESSNGIHQYNSRDLQSPIDLEPDVIYSLLGFSKEGTTLAALPPVTTLQEPAVLDLSSSSSKAVPPTTQPATSTETKADLLSIIVNQGTNFDDLRKSLQKVNPTYLNIKRAKGRDGNSFIDLVVGETTISFEETSKEIELLDNKNNRIAGSNAKMAVAEIYSALGIQPEPTKSSPVIAPALNTASNNLDTILPPVTSANAASLLANSSAVVTTAINTANVPPLSPIVGNNHSTVEAISALAAASLANTNSSERPPMFTPLVSSSVAGQTLVNPNTSTNRNQQSRLPTPPNRSGTMIVEDDDSSTDSSANLASTLLQQRLNKLREETFLPPAPPAEENLFELFTKTNGGENDDFKLALIAAASAKLLPRLNFERGNDFTNDHIINLTFENTVIFLNTESGMMGTHSIDNSTIELLNEKNKSDFYQKLGFTINDKGIAESYLPPRAFSINPVIPTNLGSSPLRADDNNLLPPQDYGTNYHPRPEPVLHSPLYSQHYGNIFNHTSDGREYSSDNNSLSEEYTETVRANHTTYGAHNNSSFNYPSNPSIPRANHSNFSTTFDRSTPPIPVARTLDKNEFAKDLKNIEITPDEIKSGKPSSKLEVKQITQVSTNYTKFYTPVSISNKEKDDLDRDWKSEDRANNRKVIGNYGSNYDVDQTLYEVIIAVASKLELPGKSNSSLSDKLNAAMEAIKLAKEEGGIALKNKRIANIKPVLPNDQDSWNKLFSKTFQEQCKKCGILSGRGESTVGLRTAYVPKDVIDGIEKLAGNPDISDNRTMTLLLKDVEDNLQKRNQQALAKVKITPQPYIY